MAGTVAPTVPSRRSGRPAVRSGRSRSSGNPQLCAWPWASPVFCQQFLHRRHVQHLIRHDPLELGILDLQLPQPLGLGCIHATVLLPPGIERGGADPVAPTDVVRLGAGLAFLKHADDLLFSETLPLHGSSSFSNSKVEDSSSQWPGYRGEGHDDLADVGSEGGPPRKNGTGIIRKPFAAFLSEPRCPQSLRRFQTCNSTEGHETSVWLLQHRRGS